MSTKTKSNTTTTTTGDEVNTPATHTRPLRAAIYVRVGHERHVDGSTSAAVQRQIELCSQAIISEPRLMIADTYIDEGSNYSTKRAAWARLIDDVCHGDIDVVFVSSLDRLARSIQGLSAAVAQLDEHDVTLVSLSEQIDTARPLGRAMLALLDAFADFEIEAAR